MFLGVAAERWRDAGSENGMSDTEWRMSVPVLLEEAKVVNSRGVAG